MAIGDIDVDEVRIEAFASVPARGAQPGCTRLNVNGGAMSSAYRWDELTATWSTRCGRAVLETMCEGGGECGRSSRREPRRRRCRPLAMSWVPPSAPGAHHVGSPDLVPVAHGPIREGDAFLLQVLVSTSSVRNAMWPRSSGLITLLVRKPTPRSRTQVELGGAVGDDASAAQLHLAERDLGVGFRTNNVINPLWNAATSRSWDGRHRRLQEAPEGERHPLLGLRRLGHEQLAPKSSSTTRTGTWWRCTRSARRRHPADAVASGEGGGRDAAAHLPSVRAPRRSSHWRCRRLRTSSAGRSSCRGRSACTSVAISLPPVAPSG